MRPPTRASLVAPLAVALALLSALPAAGQTPAKRKVFIDQDGAALGTDMLSTLAMLQSPDVEVLGITVTAGDAWVKAGTAHMLRMLELTGHGNVPVAAGAAFPLINSRDLTTAWEAQYGEFSYKGAWNPGRYHGPDEVPTPPTGVTTLKPIDLLVLNLYPFEKVAADYDPHDRLGAMNFLQRHSAMGQVVTGLLYVDREPEDLHQHFNTVDAPLNSLSEKELCPGSAVLEKINQSLR